MPLNSALDDGSGPAPSVLKQQEFDHCGEITKILPLRYWLCTWILDFSSYIGQAEKGVC